MKIKRSILHNVCNSLPLKDRNLHVLPCCLTHAWHKHFCAGTVFGMIRATVFVLYSQVLSVTGYSSTFIAIDKSFFFFFVNINVVRLLLKMALGMLN